MSPLSMFRHNQLIDKHYQYLSTICSIAKQAVYLKPIDLRNRLIT
nr:hypothetical protein [Brevibacillus laterosporus]